MHHTCNNVLSVLKPAFFENTIQNILNSALQLGYKKHTFAQNAVTYVELYFDFDGHQLWTENTTINQTNPKTKRI